MKVTDKERRLQGFALKRVVSLSSFDLSLENFIHQNFVSRFLSSKNKLVRDEFYSVSFKFSEMIPSYYRHYLSYNKLIHCNIYVYYPAQSP